MTNNQTFFAIAGLLAALAGFLKYYIDAKIDPIGTEVKRATDYNNQRLSDFRTDLYRYLDAKFKAIEDRIGEIGKEAGRLIR